MLLCRQDRLIFFCIYLCGSQGINSKENSSWLFMHSKYRPNPVKVDNIFFDIFSLKEELLELKSLVLTNYAHLNHKDT